MQYYANGDAWRLPDGAYETLFLLKDNGGYTHQVFSFLHGLIPATTLVLKLVVSCFS